MEIQNRTESINMRANLFLLNIRVGDSYMTSLNNHVYCLKRTKNAIYLSNGVVIKKKSLPDGSFYLDSKSIRAGNKNYPVIHQVLRDTEGFLIYIIHSNKRHA